VHTIHAVTPAYTDAAVADVSQARAALDAEGRKVLDAARTQVQRAEPELEVHEVFDLADPRELLLQLSDSAAMVVVGSRGRGKVRTLLLGSVSVALVRHAHCPVVVVRPGNRGLVRNGVVVGVDASELSRPVLEFAYRQASLRALPLTVLHTWRDILAGTTAAYLANLDPIDIENERVALAEAVAGMADKYPDVHVTTDLATGLPEEALVHLGERMDLIVVGAHQKRVFDRAFRGSVSVEVVEHAHCPVAVVPLSTSAGGS
jgi:nucleotide-binding universal stress UspA family protein